MSVGSFRERKLINYFTVLLVFLRISRGFLLN